ncbi:MAG: putative ABC exporter domain-containing protein [Opitutaceae bacterium]
MLGALLYLRFTSFKNWVIARAKRLRQPKYLIGAVVGFAYFYFFFFRGFSPRPQPRGAGAAPALQVMEAAQAQLPTDWLPVLTACGALALLCFATLIWVVPTQRAALGFTEAEIAFLFPAPISRRRLVHFRLLSAQFRSLIGAAVMMLFSNRWTFIGGNALTHALGWWFVFSTLNLHFSGTNFVLTRLTDLGLGAWRRRLLVFAGIGAIFAIAFLRRVTGTDSAAAVAGAELRSLTDSIVAVGGTAPLSWLLWPFKLVIAPFLAVDAKAFLLALGPALAVVVAHYLWVVRAAVNFEDSSVDYAQKRGARIAAWRAGGRRLQTPTKSRPGTFRLGRAGRPELAFLWKNLLATWPYFTVPVWLGAAAVIIAGAAWLRSQPGAQAGLTAIGWSALVFAGYVVVVGPQFARQDIRSDLPNADVLKTYPLAGWQIVLGELLTPVAILTGLLWLMLLTATLTLQPPGSTAAWLTPTVRIAAALAVALVTPALVTLQLMVPNAAALLFPSWFHLTRVRGGGPEVMGQRMIFFFAQVLTMAFALLPAGLAGAAAGVMFWWLLGPIATMAVAALAVLAVLVGEACCALWWLGQRFEKLDLSNEVRT